MNTILENMMGEDFKKFFYTEEDKKELKEQAMDEYRTDAKYHMI